MPHHNHFRHQEYDDGPPRSTYELVSTGEPLEPGCDEFQERLRVVGDRLRQAGISQRNFHALDSDQYDYYDLLAGECGDGAGRRKLSQVTGRVYRLTYSKRQCY